MLKVQACIRIETTIVIRTPMCWTTMVVFIFTLQIGDFSNHAIFIRLDTQFKSLENLCLKIEK